MHYFPDGVPPKWFLVILLLTFLVVYFSTLAHSGF